ncbi:MAG: hypothetical protein ACJASG_002244, partial [Oleiphilaceae bacterium]
MTHAANIGQAAKNSKLGPSKGVRYWPKEERVET